MKQTVVIDDGHNAIIKCNACGTTTDVIYNVPDGLHRLLQQPCKRCKELLIQDFIHGAYESF